MKLMCTMDDKIIYLRNKLNQLIDVSSSLLEPEIMYVSQLLDEVLNEYNRKGENE